MIVALIAVACAALVGWLWGRTSEWISVLNYLDTRRHEVAEDVRLGIAVDEHRVGHPLAWASPLFRKAKP